MSADLNRALAFARLALAFGRVRRATAHEDGTTPETDTDHTVMLGLLACDIARAMGLDVGLVAQMALVHDVAEVYAGDAQTLVIDAAGRAAKALREAAAEARLRREFGASSWLCATLTAYEAQATPEARFVRVLDKLLPKLTAILNGGAAAARLTDLAGVRRAQAAQLAQLAAQYPDMADVLTLMRESMDAVAAAWRQS
jgi:putative hydrolase of HD superfamily